MSSPADSRSILEACQSQWAIRPGGEPDWRSAPERRSEQGTAGPVIAAARARCYSRTLINLDGVLCSGGTLSPVRGSVRLDRPRRHVDA
jgi:hypothetical protein